MSVEQEQRLREWDVLLKDGAKQSQLGNNSIALGIFKQCLNDFYNIVDEVRLCKSYHDVAAVYLALNDIDNALVYFNRELDVQLDSKTIGANHRDVSDTYFDISGVYYQQDNYAQALEYLKKCLLIRSNVIGEQHDDTIRTRQFIQYMEEEWKEYVTTKIIQGQADRRINKGFTLFADIGDDLSRHYPSLELTNNLICESMASCLAANGEGRNLPAQSRSSRLHGLGVFATRNINKGEVFRLTTEDFFSMGKGQNDGAYFRESPSTLTEYSEIKAWYDEQIQLYLEETQEKSNTLWYMSPRDLNNPKFGCLEALEDIQKGEEMTRSYGVPGWICMTPSRVNDGYAYRQWIVTNFKTILENADYRAKMEAYSIMANQYKGN